MKRLIFLLPVLLLGYLQAQQPFTLVASGAQMSVSGTSSLHDWESAVTQVEGAGTYTLEQGQLTALSQLTVEVAVKSIKSGKAQMDKNTYEALKADAHPTLRYRLSDVQSITADGKGWRITARGQLTLAGQTRSITLTVKATPNAQGGLTFSGSIPVHMPDYGIDPPTALFGTVTTGADVTVKFSLPTVSAQPR